MASIDRRADGPYRARWHEYPGGPQKTRQFAREGDAERFLEPSGAPAAERGHD